MSYKKDVLKISRNLQEDIFIKKRDFGAGVSCKFCDIFKITFFTEHFRTTISLCENVLYHDSIETLEMAFKSIS